MGDQGASVLVSTHLVDPQQVGNARRRRRCQGIVHVESISVHRIQRGNRPCKALLDRIIDGAGRDTVRLLYAGRVRDHAATLQKGAA